MALIELPGGTIIDMDAVLSVNPLNDRIHGWSIQILIKVDKTIRGILIYCDDESDRNKKMDEIAQLLGL